RLLLAHRMGGGQGFSGTVDPWRDDRGQKDAAYEMKDKGAGPGPEKAAHGSILGLVDRACRAMTGGPGGVETGLRRWGAMKTLPAVFRRFAPYYRHLGALKLPFIGGVLAGLLYAVASGAGLPLVTKLVLPILFDGGVIEGELDWHEEWIRSWSE